MTYEMLKSILIEEIEKSTHGAGMYKIFSFVLVSYRYDYKKTRAFLLKEGYSKSEITNALHNWIYNKKKTKNFESSMLGSKILYFR